MCIGWGFILFPIVYLVVLRQKSGSFESKKFEQMYGSLMLGANVTSKNKVNDGVLHVAAFLLKRYALLLISFTVDNTGVQIALLLAIFMVASAQYINKMPVYGWWERGIGAFNCLMLVLVYVHLILFTDYLDDQSSYYAGFSLLAVILAFISVNFLFMIFEFIRAVHLALVALNFLDNFDFFKDKRKAVKKWWNDLWYTKTFETIIVLPELPVDFVVPATDIQTTQTQETE